MPEMEDSRPARPLLTLRLGITGARNLHSDQLDHIRSQLNDVFRLARAEMKQLSSLKTVADSYASGPDAVMLPRIYLITPLALGADRLAATEALDQLCQIYVPMPFPQAVYEETFTGSKGNPSDANALSAEEDCAEFRQLLSSASGRMELDGELSSGPNDDDSAGRAYEAVGRFVVRHCDLLLAVWDGKQSNGRGGTAEIVHYAATAGVPVWWIHAQKRLEPAWLANIQDIQDPAPESLSAEAKLKAYLKRLISPPAKVPRHKRSWLEQLASWFGEKDISPESTYFREEPRAHRRIWKTYSTMMNWAGRTHKDWQAAAPPIDPVAHYWFNRYAIADGRATDYAERYRSSYLLTIVLSTLTLFFGAFSLGLVLSKSTLLEHLSFAMAPCELLMLILIVAFVTTSFHLGWHRKSIEYRLLAELFRKEETLEALGWALSVGNVQRLADADRLSWVAWLFAATQRGAPLPEGSIAGKESGRAILFNLIDGQLAYHRRREKTALNASLKLETFSWLTFGALLVCVVLKVVMVFMREHDHDHALVIGLGLLATILPGISAAFVAIRSYAELQLLAEQSHHMILELHSARLRVSRLNINRALASQDLGAQAAAIATLMLQDLDGWGRLFRGKLMEA